jgi:hypothetical protein
VRAVGGDAVQDRLGHRIRLLARQKSCLVLNLMETHPLLVSCSMLTRKDPLPSHQQAEEEWKEWSRPRSRLCVGAGLACRSGGQRAANGFTARSTRGSGRRQCAGHAREWKVMTCLARNIRPRDWWCWENQLRLLKTSGSHT